MNRRTAKRGAKSREESVFLGAWISPELMALVDDFVRTHDLDRSKLLRRVLEEKLRWSHQEA